MAADFRVEIDTSDLDRGLRQLGDGLSRAGDRVGMETARATASSIRAGVPVRTGRLVSTVDVVPVADGAAVTYGGGLPYARYIEGRSHAVADGLRGAPDRFYRGMVGAATAEVARL